MSKMDSDGRASFFSGRDGAVLCLLAHCSWYSYFPAFDPDPNQGPSEFRVVRYVDPVPDFPVFRRRSGPDPGVTPGIITNMRIKIRIIWRFEVVETKNLPKYLTSGRGPRRRSQKQLPVELLNQIPVG